MAGPAVLNPGIEMLVGLGNPGDKYTETRHNAGFWFLDEVAARYGASFRPDSKFQGEAASIRFEGRDIRLLKPTTFMNHSGRSISAMARFYKIPVEHILVAHDELDLDPGVARLKRAGGHGGHNGLRDTIAAMGKDFWRLRIGIGHPGHRDDVVGYVLKNASKSERQQITNSLMDVDDVLDTLLSGQLEKAMMQLHSR
ncbi:peptidyl-tRNA hydrolase [gamma proteobacterium HTCC5015]|nr:peptidyl-tRNA hydrolase [gamma proteobacterium HTCC5015]